jgi:hypothetical protein
MKLVSNISVSVLFVVLLPAEELASGFRALWTSWASKTPLPDKHHDQKQLHPIGCTLWTPMLRFERPEKFLF